MRLKGFHLSIHGSCCFGRYFGRSGNSPCDSKRPRLERWNIHKVSGTTRSRLEVVSATTRALNANSAQTFCLRRAWLFVTARRQTCGVKQYHRALEWPKQDNNNWLQNRAARGIDYAPPPPTKNKAGTLRLYYYCACVYQRIPLVDLISRSCRAQRRTFLHQPESSHSSRPRRTPPMQSRSPGPPR